MVYLDLRIVLPRCQCATPPCYPVLPHRARRPPRPGDVAAAVDRSATRRTRLYHSQRRGRRAAIQTSLTSQGSSIGAYGSRTSRILNSQIAVIWQLPYSLFSTLRGACALCLWLTYLVPFPSGFMRDINTEL